MSRTHRHAVRLLAMLAPLPLFAGTGGPDSSGYVYTDSDETDGPPHEVLSMIGATDPGLSDDGSVTVDLPFAFEWYGDEWEQLTISNNGVAFFDGASTSPGGTCPGTTAAWVGVAPFWDDWAADAVTYAEFGRYPERVFAVQWEGPHDSAGGSGTVQLWLVEARMEAVIVHEDITFGSATVDGGASAIVGAQGGGTGLAWSCSGGLSDATSAWFGSEGRRPAAVKPTTEAAAIRYEGESINQYLGRAVAAGDLDGDGQTDVVAGNQDEDAVYLFQGGSLAAGAAASDAALVLEGDPGSGLGSSLAILDADGDGLLDLLAGAPSDDTQGTDVGAAYLISGGTTGTVDVTTDADGVVYGPLSVLVGAPSGTVTAPAGGSALGGGDINGDGYDDLLVAAKGDDSGTVNGGVVYLVYGGVSATSGALNFTADSADAGISGESDGDALATRIHTDDLDGDGADDIILTSTGYDHATTTSLSSNVGRAYLISGGALSGSYQINALAYATITGSNTSDELGWGVATGDVDGDGFLDLALGAPFNDDAASDAGVVYGFSGVATFSGDYDAATTASLTVTGDSGSANAGQDLRSGDLDGDGADDLIIASPNDNSRYSGGGSVSVFTAITGASMSTVDADHRLYGVDYGGALGTALAVADDHDADGQADVVAAAPYGTIDSLTGAGAVYLWSLTPEFTDADADGFVDASIGGLDCDDTDAAAYPGNTEVASNLVDDDCDGWVDDVVIVRLAAAGFLYDLDTELGSTATDVFDFEAATVGADLTTFYGAAGLDLLASGGVVANDTIWGAAPSGGVGARVSAGASNDLELSFASDIDAISFRLLDPEGPFDVTASAGGTVLFSGALLDLEAGDRAGGAYVGLTFSEPVDSLVLEGAAADAFGIDDITVLFAAATDRDGDGYTDNDGDCDDTDAAISPDATEDLTNGVDDDCDGTVDGGTATLYSTETGWDAALASVGFDEQVVGFESLALGEAVDTDYEDVGVGFDGGLVVVSDVDGATPVDSQAAQASGSSTTFTFEEAQLAVAFQVMDASANVTVSAASGATTLYTLTPASAGEGTAGGVFVGYIFDYPIDSVTITNPSSADDWGLDVVRFHQLGLDDADGDGYTESEGDCDDGDASTSPDATETWYDGVDSDCDGASDYDVDGDGHDSSSYGGLDCDDDDSATSPDATETWYDGVDSDCDGASDYDVDGDGHDSSSYGGTDCDDTADTVSPDAAEVWYDGIDDDCDSSNDDDADGDGYAASGFSGGLFGGGDCDDGDAGVSPGATESWYDGIDTDCDGASDYDVDGDGFDSEAYGGTDCNDVDVSAYPGASGERCYDGVDTDCDGLSDYDCDLDGHDSETYGGTDCDDADDAIHPGASDTLGDGIDSDCDGSPEFDDDGDGYDGVEDGGTDCDDTDSSVSPGATEVWYDGVDQDCDGASDYDADSDGYDSDGFGGDDCDDADGAVSPGAIEYAYDGIDQDCDGVDDYDFDGDGFQSSWYGGTDCDDTDPAINTAATEVWYDGTDQDCDGGSDYDADQDGYDSDLFGGEDCDDDDSAITPFAADIPGDGVDQNCDGVDDADDDGDGWFLSDDCDDADPTVHPGAADACYDGVDSDCGGGSDYDCDGDGVDSDAHGGTDCADDDAGVSPGGGEVWYDGVAGDCDGADDYDADGDGHQASAWGGTDCNDNDPDTNPDVLIDDCAGGDEDCDGTVDEDCAAGDDGGGDDGGTGGDDGGGVGGDDGGGAGGDDAGWTDPNEGWDVPTDETVDDGVPTSKCGCGTPGDAGGAGGLAVLGMVGLAALRRRRDD